MLFPEEVDDLDLQFKLFMPPILVSEIKAALKHPSQRQGKLPEDLVKTLARKLVCNHCESRSQILTCRIPTSCRDPGQAFPRAKKV